jgi:2-succinyl-6-hydroxy-2,4-cyclohexadiene-1-carboxylate synthase
MHQVTDGGAGERVVLVHGFTQTLASMEPLAARLRDRYTVVRVDLPGHGRSVPPGGSVAGAARPGGTSTGAAAPPAGSFAEGAALLGESGGPAAYVGYSLGGRLCLRLALDRPDLVRALVLIGASPGIQDPGERAARRAGDEELAAELERDGLERFLDRWLAQPLLATLPPDRAGRADRLANTAQGLAASLRLHGTGAQEPLWDRLPALRPPALLLAGARDPKFAALAARMAERTGPAATVALVPDAGHAAHLERPDEVATLIRRFLARTLAS